MHIAVGRGRPGRLSADAAAWVVRIVKIAEQAKAVPLTPGTTRLNGVLAVVEPFNEVTGLAFR